MCLCACVCVSAFPSTILSLKFSPCNPGEKKAKRKIQHSLMSWARRGLSAQGFPWNFPSLCVTSSTSTDVAADGGCDCLFWGCSARSSCREFYWEVLLWWLVQGHKMCRRGKESVSNVSKFGRGLCCLERQGRFWNSVKEITLPSSSSQGGKNNHPPCRTARLTALHPLGVQVRPQKAV